METSEREIKYFNIADLQDYEKNTRYHTDDQIAQVEASIAEYGFTNPILIDENRVIIAGHCRKIAASGVGLEKVPCVILEGLSEDQKKALRIADNRLPQNSRWNIDLLIEEIGDLYNSGYNVDLLGFDDESMNRILDSIKIPEPEEGDQAPAAAASQESAAPGREPAAGDPAQPADLDSQAEDLAALDEIEIKIKIPANYKNQVEEFLAGSEMKTPGGMGRGILKRLQLI